MYVREIFDDRSTLRENVLLQQLKNDPEYHDQYLRMNKENFDFILNEILPMIYHGKNHATLITEIEWLAVTLRYLVSGADQLSFDCKMSPSSVCKIVRELMEAICMKLEHLYLQEPKTKEDLTRISKQFETKWNFPMCCGAFDGKHVRIEAPKHSGSTHFNYKSYFSIVLMACADANYKFLIVDIGAAGSRSNGGVIKNSNMGKKLESGQFNLPDSRQISNSFYFIELCTANNLEACEELST